MRGRLSFVSWIVIAKTIAFAPTILPTAASPQHGTCDMLDLSLRRG